MQGRLSAAFLSAMGLCMIRIQEILDKVAANNNDADLELIQKAYVFAATAHAGQTRLSGEPYLSHPLAVADTLAEMGFDEPTVVAGLLHDTVEDTKATLEEIEENFGEEVADIVDGVTKISKISFENKEEAQAENIRKMILAMSHDMRVLMVKLADRLHNMRTLDFQKAYKQKRIAQETMDIYAPLANRLGLYIMKRNLEDLSFKYLRPDIYNQIDHWLDKHQVVEKQIIEKVVALIKDLLAANDIIGQVYGRIKHKYSIYKKMQSQSLTLDEMHDIMAFRVLVKDIRDCYAVLGLVHSQWRPVHGRFKDYISMPKANGYQSLHTTVIGPDGERIEIQIRTEDMHRQAEHGVAAHWLYKEKGRVNSKDLEQFAWLREIFERQSEESDSREFMHSLKMDLFKDEVYVYTPAGDVKELPEGATPLDFAFMIHTNVGQHCAGAKINGRLMPLGTELKNGDVVEIVTDPSRNPNRDWLKIVKTARARSRIQRYLRTEERSHAVTLGRDLLEKEGRKVSINVGKTAKEGQLALVAQEMNFDSVDDLVAAVGYAHLTPRSAQPPLCRAPPRGGCRGRTRAAFGQGKQGGRRPQNRGRGHLRRGRRAYALCQVLQPRARRPHHRLHQPGAGHQRAPGRLPQCGQYGAGTSHFRPLGRHGRKTLRGRHLHHCQKRTGRAGHRGADHG